MPTPTMSAPEIILVSAAGGTTTTRPVLSDLRTLRRHPPPAARAPPGRHRKHPHHPAVRRRARAVRAPDAQGWRADVRCFPQPGESRHVRAFYELADAVDLADQRNALFRGDTVNESEARAALHMLRPRTRGSPRGAGGCGHRRAWRRSAGRCGTVPGRLDGEPIRHVVHIGVGGSYWVREWRPSPRLFPPGRYNRPNRRPLRRQHRRAPHHRVPWSPGCTDIGGYRFQNVHHARNPGERRDGPHGCNSSCRGPISAVTSLPCRPTSTCRGLWGHRGSHAASMGFCWRPVFDVVSGRPLLAITHGFEIRRMLDGAAACHHFATAPHAGNRR